MGGGVISFGAQKLAQAIPHQDTAKLLTETFSTLESGFNRTEAGKDLAQRLKSEYIPMYHRAREMLFQAASKAPSYMQPAPAEIESQARNIARDHALGANDYRGVAMVAAVKNQPGLSPSQIHLEQQNLADHVHMFLKDTVETADHTDISHLKKWQQKAINAKTNIGPQSTFKRNVLTSKENPVRIDTGALYKPPTDTERKAVSWASKVMLPAIAIPHIGTLFNYGLNTPLHDLVRGVASATFDNKSVRQFSADSGVFASTIAEAYAVRHYGERGIIATATGKSQFGVIVNQLTHQPGFNALRKYTLSIGAATGKLTTERMAREFAAGGGKDTALGFQLRRFGLDPREILNQGGVLNADQMRKAIFNYVDNKVFLDNSMHRSFNSSRNGFMRLSNLYHGYVTRQGQLIADVIKNDVLQHKGGLVNAAQAFGMLGIVFPTVGAGLKTLEMYGRGQFQSADPKEDFKKLTGQEGISKMLLEYVDDYSHMAAFGVAHSYIQSTARHKLANQILGPIGNEVINLGEDTYGAVAHLKPKPLARDIVQDVMPDNLGKIIAHQLLPTAKEEKERSGGSHKLKGLKGVGSLKKLKGVL